MRAGETDGVDYYFISREDYDRLRDAGELLEHAEFNGHGYGIPRAQVREALAAGQDVLLRIDPQGAATIGAIVPGAVRIFLSPPSMAELERRLRGRKSETPEGLARRLAIAEGELQRAAECEYVVLNEDGKLDETVEQILAIMTAERCRVGRQPVTV
jgi:guanylate kinase